MEQKPLVRNNLTRKISSFSASKEELHKLFLILQERSYAAGDLEVSKFMQLDQSAEEYEKSKKTIKDCFELRPTVISTNGQELWGSINDIFNSPNFPEQIKSIYANSEIPLRVGYNVHPLNSFELFIDFSKPDLFNLSFLPSHETPNESKITVQGSDSTWVHGVFNEFNNFIDDFPSKLTWIHKHSVYDLLVWVAGLPFGFWIAYKLSGHLDKIFGSFSAFVQNASYVYVFFTTLILFRLLFHYARWVWPLVEFKCTKNRSLKHRLILGTLALGLVIGFIKDILGIIFK